MGVGLNKRTVRIALDAMGGDFGVEATVAGAAQISRERAGIHVQVVGDPVEIERVLSSLPHEPAYLSIVPAKGYVTMEEKPKTALAAKPDASILTACRLVKEGGADALVSAGNTGATVLAAAKVFERLPGIRRAALASVYPTQKRHGPKRDPFALMLDVGATVKASADDLVGFAVMGAAYSSVISEIVRPKVALLSNGSEALKGTPEIAEAHQRLKESPLRFMGNVEGLDIPKGTVDVIVCDGFLGNVVLKMLEGIGDVLGTLLDSASSKKVQWRMGVAMLEEGLKQLQRMTDWKVYGGAPLLGLDHVVIKAHGRSEAQAVRNAIKVAAKAVRGDLIGRIRKGMAEIQRGDGSAESPLRNPT